tara:strand:- start:394 stop:588 length:195 start_codon:yes stop_codon:yes gene_type:complete
MGKFVDLGFCEKDDPIFTECISAFSLRRQYAQRSKEKPIEDCRNAGSSTKHQAKDERQSNGENN